MDLQPRLRAHMAREIAATAIRDPGAVMQRGETIRRRRQMVMIGLPALLVVVGITGAMALSRTDDLGPADIDRVVAADAQLSVEIGSLDWEIQPATLGWSQQSVTDDEALYVLSTAPGTKWQPNMGEVPEAIYVSRHGDWTANPIGGSWVNSIAASGGLLYAVGTAPGAAAETVTLQVGTSDDAGATFDVQQLPFSPAGGVTSNARIVATPGGVLATAETLPAGPDTTVAAEIEVTQAAFWSGDGHTWEEVGYPFGSGTVDRVFSVGDHALVTVWGPRGVEMLASDNGRDWRPVGDGVALEQIAAVGTTAGRLVVVGWPPEGSGVGVYSAPDMDGPWERISLDAELGRFIDADGMAWINSAAVGPGGVAISLTIEQTSQRTFTDMVQDLVGVQGGAINEAAQPAGLLLVSRDLITWSAVPTTDVAPVIDSLLMAPDGTLIAHGTRFEGERPFRQQGSVKP